MRIRSLVIGLGLASSAAALVAAAAPKASGSDAFPKTVYLDGAAALDQLRSNNPRHYARVERILASADQICKATQPKLLALQFDAQDMTCFRSFVLTSYPPQRRLTFQIDDTRYIATVFMLDAEGKLTPIQRSAPVAAQDARGGRIESGK